jgi:hypothetical protein
MANVWGQKIPPGLLTPKPTRSAPARTAIKAAALLELGPVDQAHVARFAENQVHPEGGTKRLG